MSAKIAAVTVIHENIAIGNFFSPTAVCAHRSA
jgi:hypothetical protein